MLRDLRMVVLDEADRLLDMGFRYSSLLPTVPSKLTGVSAAGLCK